MAGKMASRKKKEKAFNVLAFFIVLILAALVLLPIWWIFRSSLMSTAALNEYPPSFIPHEWLWSNYSKALETFEYWTYFKNTFTIIIPAVTFGTITAIFCGYAFARLRFRGKKLIFNICVGTILLPGMVTLIPLYIFWTKGMGLGDTYWPLILPFLTGGGFFNIFLIRQFLMTIPKELDEAASIDGAGRMRILWTILVPSIKPAVVVVGRIYSRMADRVRILGNGILYGGNWHAWDENGAEQLIVPVLGENIEIRGITLLDGGSWHIVPVACKNVLIEDVNVLGKVITGDGVDIVGCENVVLRNCFIRANDDCISIKAVEFQDPSGCTDVRHILVEDCLFWNAEFGNTLEIGYETRCDEITDVVFRNCDVVHCQYEGNQSGGVLTIHNADRAHVHDIVYENIRIEDAQEKFIDIKTLDSKYSRDRERGMVNDIFFKNIEITEGAFPVSIIRGFEMKNEVCRPHGFYFDNVVIHGEKVMSPGELHMVVELSDELKFQ